MDLWIKSASKREKLVMNDTDWYTIGQFIQDLFLLENGLTTKGFNNDLHNRLKENCDGEGTIQALKEITNL